MNGIISRKYIPDEHNEYGLDTHDIFFPNCLLVCPPSHTRTIHRETHTHTRLKRDEQA